MDWLVGSLCNLDKSRRLMTITGWTRRFIALRFSWSDLSRASLTLKLAKDQVRRFTTAVPHTSHALSVLGQGQQRKTFFSVFYLCINGGSLLSTIITPILRGRYEQQINFMTIRAVKNTKSPWKKGVKCVCLREPTLVSLCSSGMRLQCEAGMLPSCLRCPRSADGGCPGYCTPWKYVFLAIWGRGQSFFAIMLIYFLVVFIVGSGMYYKAEPEGNIMLDVCKCIGVSLVHTTDVDVFFLFKARMSMFC